MSYLRVVPRDLFNESNLLKCYGQMYLLSERHDGLSVEGGDNATPFDVRQSDADGSTYLANVAVYARGKRITLSRPLNSRDAWPLWVEAVDDEDLDDPFEAFTDEGKLSPEFLALLG